MWTRTNLQNGMRISEKSSGKWMPNFTDCFNSV
jgi:hypothetical protein